MKDKIIITMNDGHEAFPIKICHEQESRSVKDHEEEDQFEGGDDDLMQGTPD